MQYYIIYCLKECQKKLEHKLGLDSYLLKPIQRLTKYQLLIKVGKYIFVLIIKPHMHVTTFFAKTCCLHMWLKELLKYSSDCEGTSELQGALTAMLDLLKSVNDSMHQISITGYEVNILFIILSLNCFRVNLLSSDWECELLLSSPSGGHL